MRRQQMVDCGHGGTNKEIVAAVALPLYCFLLPFFMLWLLTPWCSAENQWFLMALFTFLSPFTAVMRWIVVHRIATRRRTTYTSQLLVFLLMVAIVCLMLSAEVYHL